VSCLALQIDNGPVFFPLIQMFESQATGFVPTQPAGKQQRKKRTISFSLWPFPVRGSPEREALLNSQPVAQAHTQIPDPLDAANPRGKIGTQQAGVCSLIGEAPNGSKTQINGSGGKQSGLKVAAITENHGSVQGEARLRAVPIDELVDGMAISTLTVDAGQAVQDCRL
jgi:hypothetical protein